MTEDQVQALEQLRRVLVILKALDAEPWTRIWTAPYRVLVLKVIAKLPRLERDEEEDYVVEPDKCRALWLDIIRRAVSDYVIYSGHKSVAKREIAAHARTWLFEEEPGHPWWEERRGTDYECLSLLSICELLDLDPETVRKRARTVTAADLAEIGRPPERRHRQPGSGFEVGYDVHIENYGAWVVHYEATLVPAREDIPVPVPAPARRAQV